MGNREGMKPGPERMPPSSPGPRGGNRVVSGENGQGLTETGAIKKTKES